MLVDFQPVEKAFADAVDQGVFPGAVLLVGRADEVVYERAFGSRSLVPERSPMHAGTIFDVASLTKPLATSAAVMLLVREKKIRLSDRVTRFFPTFGVFGKNGATVRQLLNHSAGLAAWKPFYEDIVKAEKAGRINFVASRAAHHYALEQIHHDHPASPPGTRAVYSDLGYMVLGQVVEAIAGSSLDRFCQDKIFKPLGMHSTAFVDLAQIRTKRLQPIAAMIAPTENCPWRKKILCGEVHDDNAYAMGGVAGHAGLFSCARDIHLLVATLSRCLHGQDAFWPQTLVGEFCKKDEAVKDSTYALGWDTPSSAKSTSGNYFSPRSVGHLGFTGTSLWWDQEKDCHIILLSNRIHPTRKNEKIRDFRPYIHDLIMKALHP